MWGQGPNLHDRQHGFRPGKSTLDAIQCFRDLARAVVEEEGGVLLAVSLDITNAFNTLPWLLTPRVRGAGLAVASLLRNHGGPGWRARRLYVSAVLSIALYGAPIWATQLRASRDGIARMRAALRPLYIRAVRGFRTLSYMAATTLARSPPVELIAEERSILYWKVKGLREAAELSAKDLQGLKS
ncbi:uncharacterized protein LOC112589249 [Harpegnathos saltator]|uniref:uncharacterized protein LOC112589249 n=1 Tax=Harpegnathos saltator TaxID=610380 RepID=UPI000DBEEBD7|nr:uncharacterized protein LOC112589249 [Harpegnathos saltator]